MRERPILFSGPMVRAILDGRKTQTRRVAHSSRCPIQFIGGRGEENDPLAWGWEDPESPGYYGVLSRTPLEGDYSIPCPYGVPGDRLWVRETHYVESAGYEDGTGRRIFYRASDGDAPISLWRPSIFMPRWASRITLEVTAVRVERVQDISEEDAEAEGCVTRTYRDGRGVEPATLDYRALWNRINGKRPGCAWDDNPWVWVVEFRRLP